MPLSKEEMEFEKKNLHNIKRWIDDEGLKMGEQDKELKNRIESLRKQSKGKYSEELETKEKLYRITHKNLEKYKEAKLQPYFGRIDFREYKREEESFYIGKFGLGDMTTGDEKVIDWRAPIADLYYSGTYGDTFYRAPLGVISGKLSLKRKFLIKDGELYDAFDEGINEIILRSSDTEGNALIDEFLRINLEESVSSKLKDVVATIQKEQNDIIRAEKNRALIVQGSAGSGKTTVALHRLAYLIYKYKENLTGQDILVIAPNKLFLDYISEVLPDLGIDNVKQSTFETIAFDILGINKKIYTKDKKLAEILENDLNDGENFIKESNLKGSMLFKTVIDKYIEYMEEEDLKIDHIKVDNYVLFEEEEIHRLYSKDMVNLPLNKRKDEIKRYLGLKLNSKIKDIHDKIDFSYEYMVARTKKSMEDGELRRKKLIEIYDERDNKKKYINSEAKKCFHEYFKLWKRVNTEKMYLDLYNREDIFKEVLDDKMSLDLISYIKNILEVNYKKGIVDSDDLSPMLYLKFRVEGVPEKYKYKHLVIDEAQDYSILQMYVLKEISQNNSMTIVGDLGQGIYYYKGIQNWNNVIDNVFKKEANYVQLTQSYRSTVEIIDFANKVLKKQENSLKPALPVLRHGKKPEVIEFKNNREFGERVDLIVKEIEDMGKSSIAIIGKTHSQCKKIKEYLNKYSSHSWVLIKETDKNLNLDKIIIPAYMTKGLEFDCSVIYNCDDENYKETNLDKKVLYVALTRALHLEYVFYKGKESLLIK